MIHSIISMIGILTVYGILSASPAIAIEGPLANATISFGQWETDPPLDRLLRDPAGGAGNSHLLIPQTATIKEGGTVNFIISGGHVVAVFDEGTKPEDITDTTSIEPTTSCPQTAGGVLTFSTGRIYRGPCFAPAANNTTSDVRRDGVEVVQFTKPGTYLVICARKNHFVNDGMFGFVKVLPGK
jgi:hypothetical protein